MKNKNIKNMPKNVVDGFSGILDFKKFIKGIHQLYPQNHFSTTIVAIVIPPPSIETIYKKFIFRFYRN